MTEETPTERVSMVWPKDLKTRVREKVGHRGLTEFVLDAVEIHLQEEAKLTALRQEINELRWLVQQLGDLVAIGGDYQERLNGLMELELPDWLDTNGWPVGMAERVAPAMEECPHHSRTYHRAGEECGECKREAKADPTVPVAPPVEAEKKPEPKPESSAFAAAAAPEVKAVGDDMLAKVMAKAQEKGVELADISLQPASSLPPKPRVPDEPEPASVAVMTEEEELRQFEKQAESNYREMIGAPVANLCPTCQDELVDGECWNCDL